MNTIKFHIDCDVFFDEDIDIEEVSEQIYNAIMSRKTSAIEVEIQNIYEVYDED